MAVWHSCANYAISTLTIGKSLHCKEGIKASVFTSCGSPSASPSIFSIFLMMATFWWARSGYSILLGVGAPCTNESNRWVIMNMKWMQRQHKCKGKGYNDSNMRTLYQKFTVIVTPPFNSDSMWCHLKKEAKYEWINSSNSAVSSCLPPDYMLFNVSITM